MNETDKRKQTGPQTISRREALKRIAKGVGLVGTLSVTGIVTQGQNECAGGYANFYQNLYYNYYDAHFYDNYFDYYNYSNFEPHEHRDGDDWHHENEEHEGHGRNWRGGH